ncbi:hypothetical protein B0T14DRAFT_567935 [Immersiella caudata]|uniref:FAD/NAD(P)-binding domain-containing protein n=1 Tax=Immersiella caudata TaxID=314043 RepID=A0AA40BWJ7_9PEZI|nr:hypothetical protein B0T14DRAFT_567935 [Immersiella caudata]
MRPNLIASCSALALAVNGAVLPRQTSVTPDFDAIVVGGGPAGLSALSGLVRARRKVLLIDSGVYRNAPTRHMHDVLGFDGFTPAYFRWAARQQLSHYDTVDMINGTVTKITPGNSQNTYFTLATSSQSNLTARKHADQPLGLLGPLTDAPGAVRETVTLNSNVVAFVNGTDTPAARAETEKKTIKFITRLREGSTGHEDPSLPTVAEHDWFRVEFTEGLPVERAAFLASFPSEQTSNVGRDLGVQLLRGRLSADPTAGLVTNVPGVYAIGDANSDNVTNVPHALFSGKRTAVYLHVRLAREDGEKELNGTIARRDMDLEARALWDAVNGEPGDILYAGEFDSQLVFCWLAVDGKKRGVHSIPQPLTQLGSTP